jgi:hypothetical protein
MKSLLVSLALLLGLAASANAQCASGYTQLSNVYVCQPNAGAPVITSSLTANGTVGTAFSYQITATNSPTSYGATGLPSPLTVNTSTGLISGTPSAAFSGNVGLSATNSSGTGNATLALTINATSGFKVGYQTIPTAIVGGPPQHVTSPSGPYTMPQTGTLQSVSAYLTSSSTCILGVYDNSGAGGSPRTLLATTASASCVSGWNTLATTTHPVITSGTVINLAILPISTTPSMPYDTANPITFYEDSGGDNVMPATFGATNSFGHIQVGIYATFQ